MKEHTIIFSTEMVRATLEGRKTQTRRIIKPQPKVCPPETRPTAYPDSILWRVNKYDGIIGLLTTDEYAKHCPYGQVGDRLWVREAFWQVYAQWEQHELSCGEDILHSGWYWATPEHLIEDIDGLRPLSTIRRFTKPEKEDCSWDWPFGAIWRKRPSIHMPKWAARIFLEITNIRVERVQDIDAVEAEAEGMRRPKRLCPDMHDEYILLRFQRLWDSLNAKRGYGWDKNPWVWVIEFKRISKDA